MTAILAWIIALVFLVFSTGQCCHVIAEKGESIELEFTFAPFSHVVICQLWDGRNIHNLSTCNMATKRCSHQLSPVYSAQVLDSTDEYKIGLNVTSARVNETQFQIVNETGHILDVCHLEVFVWPSHPSYSFSIRSTDIEISVRTQNVYPSISAALFIDGLELSANDIDSNNSFCKLSEYGKGSLGDYSGQCTWRIPMSHMASESKLRFEVSANVTNLTQTDRSPDGTDITFELGTVQPVLLTQNCPVGYVHQGFIKTGTTATCKCDIKRNGYMNGHARWYTLDGIIVGEENTTERSSTLVVSYDPTNQNRTYECRGENPSKEIHNITYTPTFADLSGPVIAENGQNTSLQCIFRSSTSSITWQIWDGLQYVNLSICTLGKSCTDGVPTRYRGRIQSSAGVFTSNLDVINATINETEFRCLSDSGLSYLTWLEVYVWPSTPNCTSHTVSTYSEVTCTTSSVYPRALATLHRTEEDMADSDFGALTKYCSLIQHGSGSLIQYSAKCVWRIPIENLLETNHFYVEMSAYVSNLTDVNRPPAVSSNFTIQIDLPRPVLHNTSCPVGAGVSQGGYILIGTNATCKCDVQKSRLLNGQARWYTRDGRIVGKENKSDYSSTLTITHNSSDPHASFECRATNPTKDYYSLIYAPKFNCTPVIVEQGHNTSLQCTVRSNVSSLIWQLWDGQQYVNVTTCTVGKSCTGGASSAYHGNIRNSTDGVGSTLDIIGARINETDFRCLGNDGVDQFACLEVYSWPITPSCKTHTTGTYELVTCTTTNVYPGLHAVLHRRELELVTSDFEARYTSCKISSYGNGTLGDYSIDCSWRIPMKNMLADSHFYTTMTSNNTNFAQLSRTPATSPDVEIHLDLPTPILNENKCPVGPGVSPGGVIKSGTNATCQCDLQKSRLLAGQARWYTADGAVVGAENSTDFSSILTVFYNSSDPNPTFECRGSNPTREYRWVTYTPVFN